MLTVLRTDGSTETVNIRAGSHDHVVKSLEKIIGGEIGLLPLKGKGEVMASHMEPNGKRINWAATKIASERGFFFGLNQHIRGDAVVLDCLLLF